MSLVTVALDAFDGNSNNNYGKLWKFMEIHGNSWKFSAKRKEIKAKTNKSAKN